MSEQEEKDYIEEIDPEEFKAYKDFYDLTNKHCDLVIYSLWHAEEISEKILGANFPMAVYLHREAKDYGVNDCPEGKLAAYEILLNEFKTGCSFSNGMKGEITLRKLCKMLDSSQWPLET